MSLKSKLIPEAITTPKENIVDSPNQEMIDEIERIKEKARMRKLRELKTLADRVIENPDGSLSFTRFSSFQIAEHYILIVSFTTLAFTGLLQTFSSVNFIGQIIQVLGSIEGIRAVHHLAAIILVVQSLYHAMQIFILWAVKREKGPMWPRRSDFTKLIQQILFNLGVAKSKPEYDHFSMDEKLEYWAMLWGTPLMILTGLILWFPVLVTQFFPGILIPISLTIHRWEAILAVLAILTWHMYHTNIRVKNRSIFNGSLTEEEMKHEHALEYKRIMAAYEFIQKNNQFHEN